MEREIYSACNRFVVSVSYVMVCVSLSHIRLSSTKHDIGAQIKVDFEKAFSIRGTPVGEYRREKESDCLNFLVAIYVGWS